MFPSAKDETARLSVLVINYCNLGFIWNLVLEFWDLSFFKLKFVLQTIGCSDT
jgi:hypothetical protein